ncbi:zinc finger protein, partial [Globisporangium splendens]
MPPKKVAGPSKKSVEKKKEKMVEDKTFGLKNKNKSKNVQKYIQEVTKQVKGGNTRADRLKEQQIALKKKPVEDPMKAIFAASITQPKLAPGVDPKSVLCAFFKAGVCAKGNRCKYAHDLNVEKKSAKINLYSDARDQEKAQDNMETWDQSKLESVVAEKHGEKVAKQTDIVCKHFLDAIERSLYGWFWVCPNGGASCKYRHALPPGYVFKTRAEREAEKSRKVEEISIEEIIEQQRAKLGPHGGTPVTAESLAKWKEDKIKRKKVEEEKRRKEEMKKTGGRGIMSGRALFTFDPTLFRDDADADEDRYSYHDPNEERDDDLDDEEDEEKPAPSLVDAAAAVMDKSLYLQDAEDLDSLKE